MATQLRFFLDASIYVCAGFGAVIPLLYLNVRFSRTLGLIDWPKARGLAEDHVPIVGPSLVVVALVTLGVMSAYFPVSPWVISCAAIIGLMGYFDDRRALPALDKLFFQAMCSAAVVYLDPQISTSLSAKFGMSGLLLGALFMVAVMNAVNFIDGIDGLAGVVLLAAFGVIPFLGMGYAPSYPYLVLACVMVGALLPFLHLNVRRRKGFLGNVGVTFLVSSSRRRTYRFRSTPPAFSLDWLFRVCAFWFLSRMRLPLSLSGLARAALPFALTKGTCTIVWCRLISPCVTRWR